MKIKKNLYTILLIVSAIGVLGYFLITDYEGVKAQALKRIPILNALSLKNQGNAHESADASGNALEVSTSGDETANDGENSVSGEDALDATDIENNSVTQYVIYPATEVNSPYYEDVGKIALTTEADYITVDDSYFDDACFIGDSRVLGLYDYSGWANADYFCDNGYCTQDFKENKEVTNRRTEEKATLQVHLSQKQYGKVYIMLGINDCGYGNTENFKERYTEMLETIKALQPNAIIYLCANLHITYTAEEEADPMVYSNLNINAKNVAIAELADGVTTFYLDFNGLFCDDITGWYLNDALTFDGYHLYAQYYPEWTDFFKSHAILR